MGSFNGTWWDPSDHSVESMRSMGSFYGIHGIILWNLVGSSNRIHGIILWNLEGSK